jgi:hypothetical protein
VIITLNGKNHGEMTGKLLLLFEKVM